MAMIFLLHYAQQVRNFRHCAAHRIRIPSFDDLVKFSQTEAAYDRLVRFRRSNKAAVILDPDFL